MQKFIAIKHSILKKNVNQPYLDPDYLYPEQFFLVIGELIEILIYDPNDILPPTPALLILLAFIPLVGAIIIFFYNFITTSKNDIKKLAIFISGGIFIITLFIGIYWIRFISHHNDSIFINIFQTYPGINYSYQIFNSTLVMLIIIALITFICSCLASEKTYLNLHTQLILYFILECFAFNFFLSGNLFFVYFFFEISIIPIFIIIGIWGSNFRKNTAFYYIYGITGFGSILILIGLFMLYAKTGNLNTLLLIHRDWLFSLPEQTIIVSLIVLGFLIKLPIIGFYNWLLEAHVEATVEGSIILSGFILKYSLWGLIFHTNIIFPKLINYLGPFATIIIGLTIIYSIYALTLIHDFKKCIAYSSIAHMGIAYLGLSTLSTSGLEGALLTMFSHSVISPGLFIVAGILYDKYGTRNIRNLKIINSNFQIYFIILTLCNIGFPGTLSFISEILILFGILPNGDMLAISLPLGVNLLINGIFFIWLMTRVSFKPANPKINLTLGETCSFLFLICFPIIFGIIPILITPFIQTIIDLYPYILEDIWLL